MGKIEQHKSRIKGLLGKGNYSIYQISKKLELNYSTAYSAVRELLLLKEVESYGKIENNRNQKIIKLKWKDAKNARGHWAITISIKDIIFVKDVVILVWRG